MNPPRPRKQPHSRRGDPRTALGPKVGPENRHPNEYEFTIIFICSTDGTELGRAMRKTCPDLPADQRETETTYVKGYAQRDATTGELRRVLPRDDAEGFQKWRFQCDRCGRDVPKAVVKIEAAMNLLATPWRRDELRYRV